jgi:hypothetical protein
VKLENQLMLLLKLKLKELTAEQKGILNKPMLVMFTA